MNPVKVKSMPISLGDQVYNYTFDLNAMAAIEDFYDTVQAGTAKFEAGSARAMRVFLWAGLCSNYPDLTLEDIGTMVACVDWPRVQQAIVAAINVGIPDEDLHDTTETAENVESVGANPT